MDRVSPTIDPLLLWFLDKTVSYVGHLVQEIYYKLGLKRQDSFWGDGWTITQGQSQVLAHFLPSRAEVGIRVP